MRFLSLTLLRKSLLMNIFVRQLILLSVNDNTGISSRMRLYVQWFQIVSMPVLALILIIIKTVNTETMRLCAIVIAVEILEMELAFRRTTRRRGSTERSLLGSP